MFIFPLLDSKSKVCFFLFESVWCLNEVAKELENPFGQDLAFRAQKKTKNELLLMLVVLAAVVVAVVVVAVDSAVSAVLAVGLVSNEILLGLYE